MLVDKHIELKMKRIVAMKLKYFVRKQAISFYGFEALTTERAIFDTRYKLHLLETI